MKWVTLMVIRLLTGHGSQSHIDD